MWLKEGENEWEMCESSAVGNCLKWQQRREEIAVKPLLVLLHPHFMMLIKMLHPRLKKST